MSGDDDDDGDEESEYSPVAGISNGIYASSLMLSVLMIPDARLRMIRDLHLIHGKSTEPFPRIICFVYSSASAYMNLYAVARACILAT